MRNQLLIRILRSRPATKAAPFIGVAILFTPVTLQVIHLIRNRPPVDCPALLRRVRVADKAAVAAASNHLRCLRGGECDEGGLDLVEEEEARAEKAWRAYARSCMNKHGRRP